VGIVTLLSSRVELLPTSRQGPVPRAPTSMGRPEEAAAVVALPASEQRSYVVGANVYVDGGYVPASFGRTGPVIVIWSTKVTSRISGG
jgi:NAD(P)-dependent dehydrogenase (short-subunit alcohol dehydrogenase family)